MQAEVQAAYLAMFPDGEATFVPTVFGWVVACFSGGCAGHQAIDARYHDLEHTMQGTLCMARLLRGRQAAGAQPVLSRRTVELGFVAMLLHDTGYLKRRGDTEGTGAKYTVVHVARSAAFAARLLRQKGFPAEEIRSVQNMIRCTGINAALETIPFQSESERVAGFVLGTADLLGQMAAEDYVDKLPVLYSEFEEASRHMPDKRHFIAGFKSARDLMERTPAFWQGVVLPKLIRDFGSQHLFLNDPYPDGRNAYVEQIEANMKRLRGRLASGALGES